MRLLFVARAMDSMAGGVERMIIAVMTAMVERGHDVALFSWDQRNAMSFYPMDERIAWHKLDMGDPKRRASRGEQLARLSAIRRIVRGTSPDVIVCFQGGPFRAMLAYTMGMSIPLVAAERTSPTLYEHVNSTSRRFVEHQSFRFARRILVQFERYRTLYPRHLRNKIVIVPNPVPAATAIARPEQPNAAGRFTLLSVGRLSFQKNFEVLLEAFATLADKYPEWDLRIVGEGEKRAELDRIIATTSALRGRVALPGATTHIADEYAAANLFCLPARWEGFPNALAEALAHGLPSVGFGGCAGVPDLIVPGQNGTLATGNDDAAALATALTFLMADHELRNRMGNGATASVEVYRPDKMFDLWERTLLSAAAIAPA